MSEGGEKSNVDSGGGKRLERGAGYGGTKYDRERPHDSGELDSSRRPTRQGPKRYQEQRRDWKKGNRFEKDKKKDDQKTEESAEVLEKKGSVAEKVKSSDENSDQTDHKADHIGTEKKDTDLKEDSKYLGRDTYKDDKRDTRYKDDQYMDRKREGKYKDGKKDDRYKYDRKDDRYKDDNRNDRYKDDSRNDRYKDDRREDRYKDDRREDRYKDDRREDRYKDDRREERYKDNRRDEKYKDNKKDERFREDRRDERYRDDRKGDRYRDDRYKYDRYKDDRLKDDRRDDRYKDDRKGDRRDDRYYDDSREEKNRDNRRDDRYRDDRYKEERRNDRYKGERYKEDRREDTKYERKEERNKDVKRSDDYKYNRKDSQSTKKDDMDKKGKMEKNARGDNGKDKEVSETKGKSYQESRRASKDKRSSDSKGQGDATYNSSTDLMSMLNKGKEKSGKVKIKDKEIKSKGGKSANELEAKWQREEEERRKKEEAEKKAEEEKVKREEEERLAEEKRIKDEEERKKREEQEAQRLHEEEVRMLAEFIDELHERGEMKSALRETNLSAAEHRPDEGFFTKLDSNLKKNTAFVKKLKNLTELQREALSKDFSMLNLSKYVGEAAAAITEAKLKMSDINCALHLCSLLHQRYADFSPALLENWNRVLIAKKDERITNPSKLRVDLRFFAELIAIGVFTDKEGLPVLANQLTFLISNDKDDHNNLTIMLSFCKHCGDDYAGLLPRKYRVLAEKHERDIPNSTFLPSTRKQACRNLLKEYYTSLCRHILKDHKELKGMEKQNRKILQTKGELSSERKERYDSAQQSFQKLLANTAVFSDLLDEPMPELPEEEKSEEDELMGFDLFNPLKSEYEYEGDSSLFEDDDTRMFYENLPDLKSIIPSILYKDSEQAEVSKAEEENLNEDMESLNLEDLEAEISAANEHPDQETSIIPEKNESTKDEKGDAERDQAVLDVLTSDVEEETDDTNACLKLILEAFLQNLPNCVNREIIDKAAEEFCLSLNTKSNRRKLVRTLFTVHRTRYDLLPFYSRLVATLHPCMPDVANDLACALKSDFRWHVKKKDQINIESKMKTVRYIGELVKFNMFPKSEALHCLKMLLFDFSHHNIEMACALVDTCGRFLYRSPDAHHRTKVYLDLMMRKKCALHLDSRYNTMIENAYYYSNPPEVSKEAKKVRPPMHEYIRRLLYKDLSKINTEKILRQIRKIDWDDSEISLYIQKCLTSVVNVRYNTIHCMANLLAGLAPYHEGIAIQVIDNILEDIRAGMEINHPKFNQRRVSSVKYLGELYNYRMVESAVIFKTLYSFITFGVSMDESYPSLLDPPEHLFRIRLTCVLLDTCGQYFDRGSSKKKLDCFLVYFQRYFWHKRNDSIWTENCPFPMDVEYLLRDTIEALRPKLKICESYEEAIKAADNLDSEFKAKLAEILPSQDEANEELDEEDEDGRAAAGLTTITEEDEIEDRNNSSQAFSAGDHSTQDSDMDRDMTGSQSQPLELTGEYDADDDDVIMSPGEEEEDDSFTVLSGGPKLFKCKEDDDFMSAFDTMLSDTMQQRHHETAKAPQADIAIPMHLKGQKPPPKVTDPLNEPVIQEDKSAIQFTVLTKKGTKQQLTTLSVPITAEFATKFIERGEAERVEKEKMKRVVLDFHERQEEEDYQEMIASLNRPMLVNHNRERRVRYQHPKGAPDADLIFGSKKR